MVYILSLVTFCLTKILDLDNSELDDTTKGSKQFRKLADLESRVLNTAHYLAGLYTHMYLKDGNVFEI